MPFIPEKLRDETHRFIKVAENGKQPIEKGWVKTTNYSYKNKKLQEHLKNGGNYGVLGGHGNLVILDCDTKELVEIAETCLPETLTIETGSGGRHYYYKSKDLDKPLRLKDVGGKNVGDIQGMGKQVVGPTCIHPNGKKYRVIKDININKVTKQMLKGVFSEYLAKNGTTQKNQVNTFDETLSITRVVPTTGLKKRGEEYQGAHPVHGSDGGNNFTINPSKNVWFCFRHDIGGGPLSFIAIKEGIINCGDDLDGENFKKTLEIARDKYGLEMDNNFEKSVELMKKRGFRYDDGLWEKDGERYTILKNGTVERYYTLEEKQNKKIKMEIPKVSMLCPICGENDETCPHTREDIHKFFYKDAKQNQKKRWKMKESEQKENMDYAQELGFEMNPKKPGLMMKEEEVDGEPIYAYLDFRQDRKRPDPVNGVPWARYFDNDDDGKWRFVPTSLLDNIQSFKDYKDREVTHDEEAEEKEEILEEEASEIDEPVEAEKPEVLQASEVNFQVEETNLVPAGSGIVKPVVTPQEFKENWDNYRALRDSMIEQDDIVKIQGKPYLKKGFWRKIATAFNLSDEIIKEEKINVDDGFMWKIMVRTLAPNGRVATGVGVCDSRERNWAHPEHDVYATCHTRAKNRAISDLVGGGEVSAEEMM